MSSVVYTVPPDNCVNRSLTFLKGELVYFHSSVDGYLIIPTGPDCACSLQDRYNGCGPLRKLHTTDVAFIPIKVPIPSLNTDS